MEWSTVLKFSSVFGITRNYHGHNPRKYPIHR